MKGEEAGGRRYNIGFGRWEVKKGFGLKGIVYGVKC